MNILIRKLKRQNFLKILVTILLITIIGHVYQSIMVNYESKKYSNPGQLIEVYNHKMHIYSKGEGKPTVVFTVGSGTPSAYTDYYFIQENISKETRTISYDRLGYGWSDRTSKDRGIDQVVDELHTLLEKSGEKPPYILVGHSLSSLEVIRFAQIYSKEVVGVVLIDGGNPTYYATLNEQATLVPMYTLKIAGSIGLIRTLGNIGILLPLTDEKKRTSLLPEKLSKIDKALFYKSSGEKNNIREVKAINENARKVIEGGNIGNIPLIILTSDKGTKDMVWKKTQVQLKDWSIKSTHEIVKDSTHYIHWDKPNIVNEKIKQLIESLK
ncbi:MAG: alpha/beta hydrolase [Firmicutes bacterium]|nr:alpha/beta hydrolase [Bacillota bacterium]